MSTIRLKHGKVLSGRRAAGDTSSSKLDLRILAPVLALTAFGLLMVYDASVVVSMSRYGHNFHFVSQQAISLALGLVAMFIVSRVEYHTWLKLSPLILAVTIIGLFAVFIPGLGVTLGGATSWLKIGPLPAFQPSYPLIIALIIYLAKWLTSEKIDLKSVKKGFVPYMVLVGLIAAIVAVPQGDLGTAAIIMAVAGIMYFLAGASLSHFLILLPVAGLAGLILIITQPYRLQRIATFLRGGAGDAQNADYQVNQLLIALGSGGWTGLGLGQSKQKYEWLPVVESDSIFAIIGEELGYLGAVIVILIIGYLIWQGFKLSHQAPDEQGRLIIVGVMSLIAIQSLINLLAAVSIIPLTGVPLPFISSGGTSLVVLLVALGIVLNISRQKIQKV